MTPALVVVIAVLCACVLGLVFIAGMYAHYRWLPPRIRHMIKEWQDDIKPRMIVGNYTPPGGKSTMEQARERADRWYK